MKVKLALAVVGALFISLLPGCRDFTMEEYQEARAERTEAQAKVAELEVELEAEQETVTGIREELEAYQTDVAELEAELETSRAKIAELEAELARWRSGALTTEETSPPEQPTPLQEEDFRYRGYEGRLVSVQVTMLNATWDNNKLTVTWELTNKTNRKIYLTLLAVKAHDQMGLKGEWKVEDEDDDEEEFSEEPRAIYPTLQEGVETPWPGETVQFNAEWEFGPLSEVITIDFILVPSGGEVPEYLEDEVIPSFTVTR